MADTPLKPCPFGCDPSERPLKVSVGNFDLTHVECPCGAQTICQFGRDAAIEAWNRRPGEAARVRAFVADVKELAETLKLPRAKAYGLVRASLVHIIDKYERAGVPSVPAQTAEGSYECRTCGYSPHCLCDQQ